VRPVAISVAKKEQLIRPDPAALQKSSTNMSAEPFLVCYKCLAWTQRTRLYFSMDTGTPCRATWRLADWPLFLVVVTHSLPPNNAVPWRRCREERRGLDHTRNSPMPLPPRPVCLSTTAFANVVACTDVAARTTAEYIRYLSGAGADLSQAQRLHDVFRRRRKFQGQPATLRASIFFQESIFTLHMPRTVKLDRRSTHQLAFRNVSC
jgi:hypothetical protein